MNFKINHLIAFSISILISFSSLCQSIEGRIVDENKKPMPYVNVHKINSNIGGAIKWLILKFIIYFFYIFISIRQAKIAKS